MRSAHDYLGGGNRGLQPPRGFKLSQKLSHLMSSWDFDCETSFCDSRNSERGRFAVSSVELATNEGFVGSLMDNPDVIEPMQANYLILAYLLSMLEGVEIGEGVDFFAYDTSSPDDVREIVEKYIRPVYNRVHLHNRTRIQRSFEYYLTTKTAPLDELWNNRQELNLDTDDPYRFFELVGKDLFGESFLDGIDVRDYTESIDRGEAKWAWSASRKN